MFDSCKNIRDSRLEFEREIYISVDAIQNKKVNITSPRTIKSFSKARKCPNNRIDLISIDESFRSVALLTRVKY
ncbi:hypothetical protein [Chryseobacterium sp. Leaf201]|uniref:hypothetical protein n=1 Tax=Chryseobacterium sp. Leaf201 TaxID=1735672 RepID=UPI0006F7D324|nr:hypothetical protein [Chryseobacterium sp. Leaf201]KQM23420.1 hypothetical protein ASE55_05445 [Chryseobacterium sp. Leaf201]